MKTARERAVRRLIRIEEEGAYVSRVSGDRDSFTPEDAREERQAAEYVAGVTRLKRWLDFLIDHVYHGEVSSLETALLQILRVGVYDLVVLNTPPHAAVNEAANLARELVRPDAARLANAILRGIQRLGDELPQPSSGRAVRDLAVAYSQPNWIVRRWREQFGEEEAVELLKAANERPTYGVRVNPARISMEDFQSVLDENGVVWEQSRFLDDFLRVEQLQAIIREGFLDEGFCAFQDEAAGLVVRVLDPQPGETIIDGMAAPGGKAIYAASRMNNSGKVLAFDIHEKKTSLIRDAAEDHGASIVQAEAADLVEVSKRKPPPQADRVLLDAPCSGLGVLAKRADLRWQRREDSLDALRTLQDDLLDAGAALVKPGGLLVYSTCSIDFSENQERVQAFLKRHTTFELEPVGPLVPEEMQSKEGFYVALPHKHGTDGAFAARLRRTT